MDRKHLQQGRRDEAVVKRAQDAIVAATRSTSNDEDDLPELSDLPDDDTEVVATVFGKKPLT